jgi:invasion protein IalB
MTMGFFTRLGSIGIMAMTVLVASAVAATSQNASDSNTQGAQGAQGTQAAPPKKQPIPWSSSCQSTGRGVPLECALEQRAFVRESGQLIGLVSIKVPGDTKKPVIMIQAPLGLFLPAGITVDIDGEMAQNYPVQTCNNNGCFAGFPISDQVLARMQTGGKFNVIFQYLDKKPFTLPMSLVGFTEAYGRIK